MDHNAVMESVDEGFVSRSHKYVDDLTTTERIGAVARRGREEGENGTNINTYHAIESQMNIETLSEICDETGLKINDLKTQLLAISADRDRARVHIETNGEIISSKESMKLLRFVFSDRPTCETQIDNLIRRAGKRVFVLRHYSKFMPGKDLIKIYCSLIRSILEYSSVTYHFLLTKRQENALEKHRCHTFLASCC